MVSLQNFLQLEDFNGVPLAAGKIYVYHQGRTELAEIYSDINGETPIANPAVLDDLGMQEIYVSNVYNYTVVVTDPYNNELFTRDIYPNGVDGDGNNRLYEGIDPIVVNNDKMAISAKKATLSVQDPLYFVEDSPTAVCIGLQESAYSGLPYVENSAIGYGMAGMQPFVSSISGLGFYALSAGSATLADSAALAGSATIADSASISYSAENAGLVTDGWETGSDGRITAYNGTAFSAGKVYSGISPVYVDNENDKIGVSSKDFLANSPLYFTEYSDRVELSISGLPPTPGLMYESGFNYESGKITGYNGSGISAGKVYSGLAPVTVDNDNDTISVASAILGVQSPLFFVEDSESATIIGVDTGALVIDIPESANWEDAYSTVNNNSGSWTSAADELAVFNTAKWDSTCDYVSSHSADWNSAASTVSAGYANWDASYATLTANSANWDSTYDTVSNNSASWSGGSTYTGDAQGALDEVYSNSANWNSTYTTVSSNSATWGHGSGGAVIPYNAADPEATYNALVAAWDGSTPVYLSRTQNDKTYIVQVLDFVDGQGYMESYFEFASVQNYYDGEGKLRTINGLVKYNPNHLTNQYDCTWTTSDIAALSYPAYSDSGKVFTVDEFGRPAWQTPQGGELPQSATEAIDVVTGGSANWDASYATLTANSANWDSTYNTVSDNSASWGQSVGGGDVYTSGFEYTTGGNISAYSGSAFVGNEPTFNLVQGYGISMTTANDSLTIANTLVLETGSI